MNIVTKPFRWIPAHRECEFVLAYEHSYSLISVFGSAGFAVFAFASDGIHTQAPGDFIYIDSGFYKGYHKITELFLGFMNWYKAETVYVDNQNTGTLIFIEDHVFTIKAGYDTGDLEDLFPLTKIAEFKPEPNTEGRLAFNISGYINKVFDVINSNDTTTIGASEVFYNTFRQIMLYIDDMLMSEHIALNSALDMFELNRDYVDTGRSLNGGNLGNHYLSCGESIDVQISGDFAIVGTTYQGGSPAPTPANFLSADFNASDFQTVGG